MISPPCISRTDSRKLVNSILDNRLYKNYMRCRVAKISSLFLVVFLTVMLLLASHPFSLLRLSLWPIINIICYDVILILLGFHFEKLERAYFWAFYILFVRQA